MWYTVLNREITIQDKSGAAHTVRAGSIYRVIRDSQDEIHAHPLEGSSALKCGRLSITPTQARTIFTRPTKDFNDAVEESFMQCEANYC